MKLPLLLLVILCACAENSEECVTCQVKITYSDPSFPASTSETEICKSPDEIEDYEKAGTFTTTTTVMGVTVKQFAKTTCN